MSTPNKGDIVRHIDGRLGMVKAVVPAVVGALSKGTAQLTHECDLYSVEFEGSETAEIVSDETITLVGMAPRGW